MGYKRYEKYKDSGVEWIGEIPEHWGITKIKHICSESAVYGLNESSDNYEDEGIRLIRTTDIDEYGNLNEKINGVFISEEKARGYVLKTGDILLSRSGSIGLSLYFDEKKYGKCTYASYLVKFRTDKFNCPRYLFYFTKSSSFYHQIQLDAISSTISNFNGQKYANIKLPLPSYIEQTAIANFLDQKTAEIDSLIADKERLIQLLQEKRQAIITEAVTKGLDPNVPMKDSGVEWIGEIPEHWEILKLKNILLINDGGTWGEESDDEEGTIVLRSTEIKIDGSWDLQEPARRKLSPKEKKRCLLKTGDLLVTKSSGSEQHIGKTAIVNEDIERLKCAFSNFMQRLRVNRNTCPKFVYYFINSYVGRTQLQYLSTTTTGLGNITSQILNAIIIPYGGYDEQTAIANFLDQKTAEIDSLIADLQNQIAKLKEYRQSLIYEAVTGKIDVRDFTSNTEGVVLDAQNSN